MSNGTRGEWPAPSSGTAGGGKPADKVSTDSSLKEPVGDLCNLCRPGCENRVGTRLECRNPEQVKRLIHLNQNGRAVIPVAVQSTGNCSHIRPAESRQLRVAFTSLFGTRELSYHLVRKGRENAGVWERGRRQRSSQRPGCNDQDRVKV